MKKLPAIPERNKSWGRIGFMLLVFTFSLLLPLSAASAADFQVKTPPVLMKMINYDVIEAEADAFVYYDNYSDPYSNRDDNFGAEPYLLVGQPLNPDVYSQQTAYLRFRIPMTDLLRSATIKSAWVQVYFQKTEFSGVYPLDYGLASDKWDEYKITYNNQPSQMYLINADPVSINSEKAGWINLIDLVDRAPAWQKNDVSFASLWMATPKGENYSAYFSSREGDYPPRLVITYTLPATDTPTPTATSRRVTRTGTATQTAVPSLTVTTTNTPFPRITRTSTPALQIITPGGKNDKDSCPLVGCTIPWWLIGGVGLAGLALGAWFFMREKPPAPPEKTGEGPFPPPILPPLRLVRFWLTQNGPGGEQPVSDDRALAAGEWYNLNLQVQVRNLERVPETQAGARSIPLDVVLFSPESDFQLERRRVVLEMPETGNSAKISVPVRAGEAGLRRVRLCIYYQNTLLQSAVLEAAVAAQAAAGAEGAGGHITRQMDYIASPTLTGLEQFSRPALNIFTNETSEGTHWVGIYSSEPEVGEKLRDGQLFVFEADHLARLAQMERQSLAEIQGGRRYHLDYPLPLDDASLAKLEQNLVSLALEGFKLYNDLFLNDPSGLGLETLKKFDAVLRNPGLISVARCRGSSTSLPWAALYSFPLDVDQPARLRLCESFKQELRNNQWIGQRVLDPVQDHLGDPQACLGRPGCPARDPSGRQIVCPFGFWGWMHQIEQPLQQIKPTPVDSVPESLPARDFSQDGVLLWKSQQKLRCAVGVNQAFANDDMVCAQIQAVVPAQSLEIDFSTDSSEILELIKDGGRQFYYFFCHGVIEDSNFKLDFSPGTISSASLYPFDINWPEQPKPLFILNGCQTTAITPELVHGFLEKLRLLGASGVVGTEIPVVVDLAAPVGSLLMYFMLTGSSIGEAFLKLRSQLLRQGNPLGLVYTYYAPADLHLHQEKDCAWCKAHGVRTN